MEEALFTGKPLRDPWALLSSRTPQIVDCDEDKYQTDNDAYNHNDYLLILFAVFDTVVNPVDGQNPKKNEHHWTVPPLYIRFPGIYHKAVVAVFK